MHFALYTLHLCMYGVVEGVMLVRMYICINMHNYMSKYLDLIQH